MSTNTSPTIVWFRNDLRLTDHPSLYAAAERGEVIVPVYIHSVEDGDWPIGAASRWWLHAALADLNDQLQTFHSRLVIRAGHTLDILRILIRETGASTVMWNRRYEPAGMACDARIMAVLREDGILVEQYEGNVLFEPESIQSASGTPYQIFTPFWKACLMMSEPQRPLARPKRLNTPDHWPESIPLDQLKLLPSVDWTDGIRQVWFPGKAGVERRMEEVSNYIVQGYSENRDRPDLPGTSRLSPHLHFGEMSARQVWHTVREHAKGASSEAYLRQLGWRDFSTHILFHAPETTDQPLKPKFSAFPWQEDPKALRAWQRGLTGYPLVDAGMRELWRTGWMHNRVRMVAGSFLVKHLLIPWQEGARWFWSTLVDADLANNTMGWQWVAGCGADAAPYFRVFNPILQSKKFDPDGTYLRRWLPELAGLANSYIHTPWDAPAHVLNDAHIILGETYPSPIIDHDKARKRALAAYNSIRNLS